MRKLIVRSRVIRIRDNRQYGKWRRRMFDFDPRCYWCGRKTVWCAPADGIMPADGATVDHLHSRYDRERRGNTRMVSVVLACYECNNRRSMEETRRIPIEELRRRCCQKSFRREVRAD